MAVVVDSNEILLNSVYYKTIGPPRRALVSIQAPRFTIGDTQRGADPRASILTQNDFRGGIGWNRGLDAGSIDRCWFSNCQLRFKEHVVLGRKTNTTATTDASGDAIGGIVNAITIFENEVYAAFGNDIHKYNDAGDFWTERIDVLEGTPTDSIVFRNSTDTYLIWACDAQGYAHTVDGSTITDRPEDPAVTGGSANNIVKYFTVFHGALWGIDSNGVLKTWASGVTAAPTHKAQLPLPDNYVTALMVYRDAAGNPAIYAATKVGLFVYDDANNRWEMTELQLPFHEEAGAGAIVWRDALYFPAGNAIYKYQTGSNTAVLSLIGFDRDHGLPSTYSGAIKKLIGTHNDILAITDAASGEDPEYTLFATGRQEGGFGGGATVISGAGQSTILGYNDIAWEVKWSAGDSAGTGEIAVGTSYSDYRLWWGVGSTVYYMKLASDIINPSQIAGFEYTTSGTMETPWFDGDDATGDKLGLTFRAVTSDCTSNQTILVEYATNFSESYTSMGTITSNGTTTYNFGSSAGTAFNSIKFKFTLSTNSSTASPDLNLIELRWREKLPVKYGWTVNIDAQRGYKGKSPKQLFDALNTAIESNTLLTFTYRNNDTSRTYYVDAVSATGFDMTGLDERNQLQLQLVEQ